VVVLEVALETEVDVAVAVVLLEDVGLLVEDGVEVQRVAQRQSL
jgi:hypothetical protein